VLFASTQLRYVDEVEKKISARVNPADQTAGELTRQQPQAPTNELVAKETKELIRDEHLKAIDEIKLYLEQQDSWYHYKFIIIGGMLALFLGQIGFVAGLDSGETNGRAGLLRTIPTRDSSYLVLALACVVSLMIDMHIRHRMFSVQTLGLWIANSVEPAYWADKPRVGYLPWEEFLRLPSPSMNLDTLYALAFSMHVHFLTILIYMVYLAMLQEMAVNSNSGRSKVWKRLVLLGFVPVSLSSLSYMFVAHAVPSKYKKPLVPFTWLASGWENVAYYFSVWLLILVCTLPYLRLALKAPDKQASAPL
jgi:hypothetical protein